MSRTAMPVPFVDLQRELREDGPELDRALQRVFASGQFILGREVEAFETEFAAYLGTRYAVGCANGQDALELILRALDLQPDDEVIVPAMTFVATANAVKFAGATLRLCDVGPDGLIDPRSLEQALTDRTRAVIPVHLYGQCADMDAIAEVVEGKPIKIVEDAAQAHGAEYRGRRAGSLGHAAAFSFYPAKNLGCFGDGGAIATSDPGIFERVWLLHNYGSQRKYHHEIAGRNSRLDELQAAVLRVKLGRLDRRNEQRRAVARRYREGLGQARLALPPEHGYGKHVYHVFAARFPWDSDREKTQTALRRMGIVTQRHYPVPIHRQPAYAGAEWPALVNAEMLAATTLSLPMFPSLEPQEIDFVIGALCELTTA